MLSKLFYLFGPAAIAVLCIAGIFYLLNPYQTAGKKKTEKQPILIEYPPEWAQADSYRGDARAAWMTHEELTRLVALHALITRDTQNSYSYDSKFVVEKASSITELMVRKASK